MSFASRLTCGRIAPRRGRRWGIAIALLAGLGLAAQAETASYRDELTFLGRTTFLFRDYALVVPVDVKRQPLPKEVFVEIKAWGAWNGSWVPYIYEPLEVTGVMPDDLNGIIARYRQMKLGAGLDLRKAADNSFGLNYEKGRTRFDLQLKGFAPRVVLENPEGQLALGVTDGARNVNGHAVTGRVASAFVTPSPQADPSGRYGLYDHFTLLLPSGGILVVYHSRTRPSFNLVARLTPDGKGDRQGRKVQVSWLKPGRDAESGRDIPTAWSVQAPEVGIQADLEEWGRNLVRYKTDAGKMAVSVNVMVRGTVEVSGERLQVFGLNAQVQDAWVGGGYPYGRPDEACTADDQETHRS